MTPLQIIQDIYAIAKVIYDAVKTAQANQTQCETLHNRIHIVTQSIKNLEKAENLEQYRAGLEALQVCVKECASFVVAFSKKDSWFKNILEGGSHKEKFAELNQKLHTSVQLLGLGLGAQQIVNREQDIKDEARDRQAIFQQQDKILALNEKMHAEQANQNQFVVDRLNSMKAQFAKLVHNTPVKSQGTGFSVSYVLRHQDITFGKVLGKGGFGVVYQGILSKENKGQTDVAVKQLLVKSLSDESKKEFEFEAQLMANLRAPNIVQFYGYCVSPEYCLVMEYMQKGSLDKVLSSPQPLDWKIRMRIATDIAKGVSFLHAENIIHRDIKSLNVLLDEDFKAKLTDFGLSKVKQESQSTSTQKGSAGTPAWMAPELAFEEGGCTKASDIYSLGITLWELTSREKPFKKIEKPALIPIRVHNGYRDPIPTDCPTKLATLIPACWDTNPSSRPDADTVVTYFKSDFSDFPLFLKSRTNSATSSCDVNPQAIEDLSLSSHSSVLSSNAVSSSASSQPMKISSTSEQQRLLKQQLEDEKAEQARLVAEEEEQRAAQELAQLKAANEAKRQQLQQAQQAEAEKKRLAEEQAKRAEQQRQVSSAPSPAVRPITLVPTQAKAPAIVAPAPAPNIPEALVNQLLLHIARGEEDEAKKLLEQQPHLLLKSGRVTDYSNRTLEGTALQLALGAYDERMVKMLLPYFDKLQAGACEKSNQYDAFLQAEKEEQAQWKKAAWDKELAALDDMVTVLQKTSDTSFFKRDATLAAFHEKCETALTTFRNALAPQRVIKGYHFNPQLFITACELNDKHYDAFGGPSDKPKSVLFSVKMIGYIQRFFPANIAQVFSYSLYDVVEKNEDPGRSLKLRNDTNYSFFPLNSSAGVGFEYFIYAVGRSSALGWMRGACAGCCMFFKTYVEQSISSCRNSCSAQKIDLSRGK